MLAPLSWIRDFAPVTAPVPEVVSALNQLGLEVEAVDEPGRDINGVIAARILDVLPHPDADKIRLADIDFGSGQTRVVCGAPNITAGMVVPYAPAGSTLPGGFTLERRTIRGEVSDGMLLSAREMGLGDDHSGIIELDSTSELGDDVRVILGLDDVIFELSITPNRPDAMCIFGVARELAAHFKLPFGVPEPHAPVDASVANDITVVIDDPERCPRYLGRVARVTMGESPAWMAQRLVKSGMRPISNVVDATNYVLLERNQPLHAFDLARLGGRGIIVRRANDGERMTTLDGIERELTAEELVIADAERAPQAIAGIMGGSTAEVTDSTTEILLEAAYFQPMGIARSSKRLKLRSESSARFERGIDPDAVARNAERALELLVQIAGGRVAGDACDEYPVPIARPRITLRTQRVNAVLGTGLDAEDVWDALAPLGIELDEAAVDPDGETVSAVPPSWRPDLEREIDLVEEVARRIGFDVIGRTLPASHGQVGALTVRQQERRAVADALVGLGVSEAITLSLVAPADLERSGAPVDRVVRASNPLRAEESVLRTRILAGLLRAVAANHAHGLVDIALFEQGRVFAAPADGGGPLPDEPEHVAVALSGVVRRSPVEPDRERDVYDGVDVVRVITEALGIDDVTFVADSVRGFRGGRAARVVVSGVHAGVVGELAPEVLSGVGLTGPVVAAELELDALFAAPRRDRRFRTPSRFPASTIDLAFVVADRVPADAIASTLRAVLGDELESVRLFDEFRSEALGEGRVSLAFALRLRAADRTLTDTEAGELRRRAIDAVVRAHGAELRG